jgi:ribosome-associated protein
MRTFKIVGTSIALVKLLKAAGLCETGGMAKMAIAEGRVTVDHLEENRKSCKIKKGQVVRFEGRSVQVV